jgi:AraC family transcriptional regulator
MDLTCTLERRYHVCATPGDITIAPRGVPTTWQHQGGVHLLLVFLAPALLAQVALEAFDTDPAQAHLVEQAATPDPLSYALTRALLGAVQSGDGAHRLYGESLAHTLVVHLLHTYAPPCQHLGGARGRFGFPQLQVVRDYIMEHLAHPLTLAELAALVNLSPYHFARVFKRTTGFTVHQYVLQQRVETGKRLLETSDLPVATVALQVGFTDHSHFWRHFKRIVGVAPGSVQRPRTIVHLVRTNIHDSDPPARYTR